MNAELCKQALLKVGNPNVLVNLVSRRVRQLNSGGGSLSRPLVSEKVGEGATDVAFRELIEDKIGFESPDELPLLEPKRKRKKKR